MTSEPARDTRLAGQNTAATADQARSGGTPAHLVVRRTRIGGIWVAFLKPDNTLSLAAARSEGHVRIYFNAGFAF